MWCASLSVLEVRSKALYRMGHPGYEGASCDCCPVQGNHYILFLNNYGLNPISSSTLCLNDQRVCFTPLNMCTAVKSLVETTRVRCVEWLTFGCVLESIHSFQVIFLSSVCPPRPEPRGSDPGGERRPTRDLRAGAAPPPHRATQRVAVPAPQYVPLPRSTTTPIAYFS